LPSLMEMMESSPASQLGFQWHPICVRAGAIPPDAPSLGQDTVRVNYISDPAIAAYRTTDRNGQRHYEWLKGHRDMGIPSKVISPGKIWYNPEASEWVSFLKSHHIYCFGRFPTWRPDELLHQTFAEMLELQQHWRK